MRTDLYTKLLNEPCPCRGCTFVDKCSQYKLACNRFLHYINEDRWVNLPQKAPTNKLYEFIFHPKTDDLIKLFQKKARNAKKIQTKI